MGCQQKEDVTSSEIQEIFSNLTLNLDYVFANQVSYNEDNRIDRIEQIDFSSSHSIYIHIMDFSEYLDEHLDYKLLITPDYIYDTRTMHKLPNTIGFDKEATIHLINQYTELIDLNTLRLDDLYSHAQSLKEHTYHKTRVSNTLRGRDALKSSISKENHWVEYVIKDNALMELHYRVEADFPSTKQESNLIEAVYYYFNYEIERSFPNLDSFFEE